jgi:hypothetical protein
VDVSKCVGECIALPRLIFCERLGEVLNLCCADNHNQRVGLERERESVCEGVCSVFFFFDLLAVFCAICCASKALLHTVVRRGMRARLKLA